ncbi:hypothetical protein BY996DRAFT_6525039 [Phakopsora pachyrhizi]|nr:hypothetical protein BY996DRAFT_6525039 [Phakopsora pachyrhizi]
MKAKHYGQGLMELVKRKETAGTSRTGTKSAGFENQKLKVYVLLMKHLDEEHVAIKSKVMGKFINLEFKERKEFVKSIRSGISKIQTTGLEIQEQVLAFLILKKLPKEFESLVRIIISDNVSSKIEEVIEKIERDHLQLKVKKAENVAMTVNQTPKRLMKCYNCGIDGHSAKIYPKEWSNYKFATPKANIGETTNDKTGAFLGIASPRWESNAATNEDLVEELEDNELVFFNPENKQERIKIFGNLGELETKAYESNVICAMTGIVVGNTETVSGANSILLDSGASDHMFIDKDNFHNYQQMEGKVGIGEGWEM